MTLLKLSNVTLPQRMWRNYRNISSGIDNGNVTRFVYSATGEKQRVVYQTAVPNITVAIGSARELCKHH